MAQARHRKTTGVPHTGLNLLARAPRAPRGLGPFRASGRSLAPAPADFPAQPTPLIGRDQEVQLVRNQLSRPEVRLLTLTGPAGTGKTRLALEAADALRDGLRDGAFLVNLAPITDARLVPSEIARTLGVRETDGGPTVLDMLKIALHDKDILLVLDNFEQVVDAAPQVADLLAACPHLKILSTSRATLRLRWEHEMAVPPLEVPDPQAGLSLDDLSLVASVALFVERAQAVTPDFRLTDENSAAVAEICVRLDGLPLAIELAAARAKLFSPATILARLEHRFDLLRADTQDRPDRHHTLRAALDWSYQLLPPVEQHLLRHMAVFAGGATLDAIEQVVGVPSLDGITSLMDQSLLRPDGHQDRVSMLETVRQYAYEQLAATGELQDAQRRHAEYCLRLVETAASALGGPSQVEWLERLDREHDNLRAALRWSIDAREVDVGLRLGAGLWRYWSTRGNAREGRVWLSELRVMAGSGDESPAHAQVLAGSGQLAYEQGDYGAARALHEESLAISTHLHDLPAEARALASLGDVAHQLGEYRRAQGLFERALDILRRLDERSGAGDVLNTLGLTVRCQGDYVAARRLYEEALSIARETGDRRREALVLNNLGRVAYYEGTLAAAHSLHEQSLAIRRQVGDRRGIATSLGDLGDTAHQQADYAGARALRREALVLWQQLEDPWGVAYALEGFAEQALVQEHPATVVQLVAASTLLRESILAPRSPASAERMQRLLEAARRRLTRGEESQAWAQGRRLRTEEAIALALALTQSGGATAEVAAQAVLPEGLGRLSPREREVAALITRGLTNRQIADALVIGERTVHTHVTNILAKLELASRTQIAAWGVERGLR